MIEILLADDHKIVLDGLSMILDQDQEIEVVGRAYNGEEVVNFVENNSVDIIVMDINMPKMDGMEATKILKREFPDIKILILSMYNDVSYITELVKAGVNGYVLKNHGYQELTIAIKSISDGFSYFGREIAQALIGNDEIQKHKEWDESVKLTKREQEVLKRFAKGFTTKQIAKELFISNSTVETHKRNLVSKAGVSSSKELIKFAFSQGLVD